MCAVFGAKSALLKVIVLHLHDLFFILSANYTDICLLLLNLRVESVLEWVSAIHQSVRKTWLRDRGRLSQQWVDLGDFSSFALWLHAAPSKGEVLPLEESNSERA